MTRRRRPGCRPRSRSGPPRRLPSLHDGRDGRDIRRADPNWMILPPASSIARARPVPRRRARCRAPGRLGAWPLCLRRHVTADVGLRVGFFICMTCTAWHGSQDQALKVAGEEEDAGVTSASPPASAGAGPVRAPGMRRGSTQIPERRAVWVVNGVVSNDLGWLFREQSLLDYGVDAQAEVVADDELVTGRLVALQIKGGDSWSGEASADGEGWVFRESSDHLAYWLGHSLPVIVVIVGSDDTAFWQAVTPAAVRETEKGFALVIPRSQPFSAAAREKLLAIAGRSSGLLESLPALYEVLPPDAAGHLRRAAGTDHLAAARLAERLASGRATPGLTAASVIAASPSWLVYSSAVQDLWLAVAGYAVQHTQAPEAGAALVLAADSPGPRSARARALAGLELLLTDRGAARGQLERVRGVGQVLLADVGLAALDIPENDARPPVIPASLRDAPADQVNSEPFLLNFLAETALRDGEYTKAVELRERAVAAGGDHETVYRLALARTLRRRALSEPGSSVSDLRRALGYAHDAVEERRRWDGPSAEALAEVLDILTAADDLAAAVTAALPASQGGTALDAEATDPDVAWRGAHAALTSRNQPAREFFTQVLPDGPYRRELQALDSEARGRLAAERITAWTRLLAEAADDTMAAKCIAALARLGVWPPQADELRARSVLPADYYDTLQAVYRARSGEPDIAIARLRELADTTMLAALQLIQLLEEYAGPGSAISEAERQSTRWQTAQLKIEYVDLLGRHGRHDAAAAVIERAIPDGSLPADVRLQLCRWYVSRQAQQRKFAEAAVSARAGLAIGQDPGLAWMLIKVLLNDGKTPAARQALERHKPEPVTDEEIRIWMQLHLGVPLTPDDARTMTGLAQRQPEGEFRDAIIAMLIREVLLVPPAVPFPADVTGVVARLEEETRNRPGTGLRIDPDDEGALRAALEKQQPDPAAYQRVISEVQRGTATMADIARFTRRPYGTVLLHRPAGILPAADLAPGLRSAGEQAARRATSAGSCAADLSSLHLLSLLEDDDRLRIRSALPRLTVARQAVDDALLTRDHTRVLAAGTYTASLSADGTIERTPLTADQQVLLLVQAETLEAAAASAEARYPGTPGDAAASVITLAREHHLVLWCDDIVLRQKARMADVAAFSLLDLVTALAADGTAFNLPAMLRRLAGQYVVDLPLTAADITALAAACDWRPGPAHTALARPAWWRHHDTGWEGTWLQIATQTCAHSADALTSITQAALTGSIQHVTTSFRTQRYQQIAVLALIGCHDAGQQPPPDMLGQLAGHAAPGLAPCPQYVLAALAAELRQRSVPDADQAARRLLPDVDPAWS